MESNNLMDQLIELSKTFKQGFTIELKNNEIKQYINCDKPFIVSYKTLIEIDMDHNKNFYYPVHIPKNCIIGGWSNGGMYFIEINKTFKGSIEAMKFAWKHKQQAIYNIRTGDVIEVQRL